MEVSNSPSPPSSCLCHPMNDLWGYNLGIRVREKHRCSQTIHQCSFPEFSTTCSQQRRAPQSARLCVLVAAVKRKRSWLVVWFCSCAGRVGVFLHRFDRARFRRVFSWSLQSARLPTAQGLPTTSGHFSHKETLLWFGATSQDSCSLCNDWVVAATLSSRSVTSMWVRLGHHRRKQMLGDSSPHFVTWALKWLVTLPTRVCDHNRPHTPTYFSNMEEMSLSPCGTLVYHYPVFIHLSSIIPRRDLIGLV